MIADECRSAPDLSGSISQRVNGFDWQRIREELDEYGHAVLEKILSPEECQGIAALYTNEDRFRTRIDMARHGFGSGDYKYFRYPLPDLLAELRSAIYAPRREPRPERGSLHCRHHFP